MRSIIAATMMAIYLCICLSPLASATLTTKTVQHAITGECSGECDICGCSPASRRAGTCCCAKKKRQVAAAQDLDALPECCKKVPPKKDTVVVLSCGCPCGESKSIVVSGAKSGEFLPYYFTSTPKAPDADTPHFDHRLPLTSRHAQPPDPPPRQA